jgi:hypothetical protein
MRDEGKLLVHLKKARRRLALLRAIRSLGISMPISALLILLVSPTLLLWDMPKPLSFLPLLLPPIWFLILLLWPRKLDSVARDVDWALELEERTSTAYELISGKIHSSLRELVLADALSHLEEIDLREGFPLRFPRRAIISLIVMPLMFLTLWLIPARAPVDVSPEERMAISSVAESLAQLPREEVGSRRLAEELRRTVRVMRRGKVDKAEALRRLAKLEAEAEREYRDASQANERLREISHLLKTSLPFSIESIESSSKLIEEVADDIQREKIPPEMLPQLERALRTLFERLKALDGDLARSLEEASRRPLSPESLRKLAQALVEFESKVDDLELLRMMLAKIREGEALIGMIGLQELDSEGRFASEEGLPGKGSSEEEATGGRTSGKAEFKPSGEAKEAGEEEFVGEESRRTIPIGEGKFELPTDEGEGGRLSRASPVGEYRAESISPDSGTIAEAQKVAEEVISSGRIPPLYREVVRRYFSSISGEGR